MSQSIYKLINNQLRSLNYFTEILESFEWDEKATEIFYNDINECLLSDQMQNIASLPEAISIFEALMMIKGYPKFQIDIVKNLIKLQADELVEINKMEVH